MPQAFCSFTATGAGLACERRRRHVRQSSGHVAPAAIAREQLRFVHAAVGSAAVLINGQPEWTPGLRTFTSTPWTARAAPAGPAAVGGEAPGSGLPTS